MNRNGRSGYIRPLAIAPVPNQPICDIWIGCGECLDHSWRRTLKEQHSAVDGICQSAPPRTYIHKIKDKRDIYFFANSTDNPVDANVVLRGRKNLAFWNPHTGEKSKAQITVSETAGQPVTTVRLTLPAITSMFFIGENGARQSATQ